MRLKSKGKQTDSNDSVLSGYHGNFHSLRHMLKYSHSQHMEYFFILKSLMPSEFCVFMETNSKSFKMFYYFYQVNFIIVKVDNPNKIMLYCNML